MTGVVRQPSRLPQSHRLSRVVTESAGGTHCATTAANFFVCIRVHSWLKNAVRALLISIDSGTQSTKALVVEAGSGKARATVGWFVAVLIPVLLFSGFLMIASEPAACSGVILGIVAVLVLVGVTVGGGDEKKIKAGKLHHASMDTWVFKLSLGNEVVALDPGKLWTQVDHFKWVARGLIDAPQSFHVAADGSVEINIARISIADPEGAAKLEHEISKRHEGTVAHQSVPASAPSHPAATPAGPARPRFRVKLDHWGHILIEWGQGLEREETGLRGLATLIANGLIRKPDRYHVDALQRGIEIDDAWYECSEAGAKRLEEALNTRYAVTARTDKAVAIEIKENRSAGTGFDIHFTIIRAGTPFEIKGHLAQENLDILQDQAKCDLIQPGIHLLLSPPYLLLRRRRPDLGEEKIAELPDVNLLRINAAQLQHILNHPLIRRSSGSADAQALQTAGDRPAEVVEMRVVRNPANKALLWLECVTPTGQTLGAKAFSHHNIAEFQHGGTFLPHLDVCLSLDHRRLSILNRQTKQEEALTLDCRSPDEELRRASRMLTNALKPPASAPQSAADGEPVGAVPLPARESAAAEETKRAGRALPAARPREAAVNAQSAEQMTPEVVETPGPTAASDPQLDPITALFREADAVRINVEIFRQLGTWLGIAAQDLCLSLPRVFENRRFQVLSFEPQEIQSLMDLRGEDFYGFYLSHISAQKIVLVYACNGTHIEWGPDKCVLQPTARSEAEEYKGSALLGLAQDRKDEFVFVVQPAFKEWMAPREQLYIVVNLRFLTIADIAAAPGDYRLIWPDPSSPRG
jgi:hypothetical protein